MNNWDLGPVWRIPTARTVGVYVALCKEEKRQAEQRRQRARWARYGRRRSKGGRHA